MLKERLPWIYNKRYDVDLKKGLYTFRALKIVEKICLSACLFERQDYKRLTSFSRDFKFGIKIYVNYPPIKFFSNIGFTSK